MFSTDGILGRNFAISAAALDGLALRQQAHAENIANIDTDGYRAKTVNFESALSSAMKGQDPGLLGSSPFGSSGSGVGDAATGALTNAFVTSRGGAVDRRTEVSAMTLDNVKFRVLTQQVTNSLSAVRSVIAEMGRG
ncbi:MAG: flagellar basal-body rod protein FlgB [Thermoleophilia bacterium]|nr:flagellar basal-body rod protein FlgB [Thermoleophilia bacterium]